MRDIAGCWSTLFAINDDKIYPALISEEAANSRFSRTRELNSFVFTGLLAVFRTPNQRKKAQSFHPSGHTRLVHVIAPVSRYLTL
jgi:hypothetical protein